jgi:hypothetical protein
MNVMQLPQIFRIDYAQESKLIFATKKQFVIDIVCLVATISRQVPTDQSIKSVQTSISSAPNEGKGLSRILFIAS